MSLQGIPGMSDEFRAFVQTVRLYMRDFPEINRIVTGEESTDRQIAWAVLDAMMDFNGTPHLTNLQVSDLLGRGQHALLLRMTVISLIESIGILQMRNQLNYSTGGTNVGINDKSPLLMNWLQYFKSYTDQMKQRVKVALNIEGILGPGNIGVHSEYWAINSCYVTF